MKVIVNIATKGDRPNQLERSLKSLRGQYDELNIYDNSKRPDYSVNAKFYFLQFYTEPVYYLTCDDDLIYPYDYVKNLIKDIEYHNTIVTYHGRIFDEDMPTYYNAGHFSIHHWRQVNKEIGLDTAGTGCTGFRTDYFNPVELYKDERRPMADLLFSLEAWKQGKFITHPPKRHDYIIEQSVDESVYKTQSKGEQTEQIKLMKEIIEYRGRII